ncbi:heparan-alpha-glucosaminide N-acetyltransferase domain-containing protein [Legionella anisa]|uniref:DUF1624 domain-containing protein n=1 Tax=Legionella anisa TaxID=28082 RepID=A0AAX0WPX4_9GAMM|nr:heparan-alpha-glucosaminide N-acetyltransferase domain-containing protein [Legionella anisa]AWN73257.1 DUF1624 domain-containing protein [Legionella anisa]KTC67063.1 hypothetical protein Lani_3408 [Legionella anisa]MCW8424102.1 heparan-alpha-glucosaminide N-acetyltransferase domain-containing protein [Legionella anisa]MCW8447625.1 heparan-alpha-glucosaminide N-acetyltransferase domain-containing protein [Legionella anisa]PNL60374.1 DUF1624 domain-containing protein [Legionella anisa]
MMRDLVEEKDFFNSISIEERLSDTLERQSIRLNALDLQRGFIMLLMSFSHFRDYFQPLYYVNSDWNISPVWRGTSWVDLMQQMFISTVVAGGFYMMMGIGVYLLWQNRIRNGASAKHVFYYLLKRGGLLIVLQLTLLQVFEIVSFGKIYFYMGVLLTLGICMIVAAGCMWLIQTLKSVPQLKNWSWEYCIPLLFVVIIPLSMQLYLGTYHSDAQVSLLPAFFFISGEYHFGVDVDINFTPIPWFPAVAFGLMIGHLLQTKGKDAYKTIGQIAVVLLGAWFTLRTGNLLGWFSFGDYKPVASTDAITWASYFCLSKYPPSFEYFLWSCGLNLLGILAWHKAEFFSPRLIKFTQPLKVFGQCALFFYLMHWFVFYGLSLFFQDSSSAPVVISCWLLGIVILYLSCISYRKFKLQKPKNSLWRMF